MSLFVMLNQKRPSISLGPWKERQQHSRIKVLLWKIQDTPYPGPFLSQDFMHVIKERNYVARAHAVNEIHDDPAL